MKASSADTVGPASTPKPKTISGYRRKDEVPSSDERSSGRAVKGERTQEAVGHPRVLVVEDNDALRTEIAELFREDGYGVLEAADGATSLDILRRSKDIDVVLLDLWMPTMDGWRF